MAEFPALPLFTDAYIADTTHLTTLQHGAYLLMLMAAWRRKDGKLPLDDDYLAKVCGVDKRTWNKNKKTLLEFWEPVDNNTKIRQGRLEDERIYVEQLSNKNSLAAKARWLKHKGISDANAMPNGCQNDAPTPTLTPLKKLKIKKDEKIPVEMFVPPTHKMRMDRSRLANLMTDFRIAYQKSERTQAEWERQFWDFIR